MSQFIYDGVDIEDMSLKTGSYKRFAMFIRMLSSALVKASDSVFIDLLTFNDLESLKRRKNGGIEEAQAAAPALQPSSANPQQNKRYLILTYVGEFDKYVHTYAMC